MKYFWILLWVPFGTVAQINLIANHSFERIDTCGIVIENLTGGPLGGDIIVSVDSCVCKAGLADVLSIDCNNQYPLPHSGNVYINNQFNWNGTGYRREEQVSLILKDKTQTNQWYYIEYWLRFFPGFGQELDESKRTGVYFTNVLDYWPLDNDTTTVVHFADTSTLLTDEWVKISGCFQLDSAYSYMVGFALNNDGYFPFLEAENGIFYGTYNIDDVILSPIDTFLQVNVPFDTICVGDCIELSCNYSLIDATFDWVLPGSDYNGLDTGYIMVCYDEIGVYDVGLLVDHCAGTYDESWLDAITVIEPPLQIAPDYQIVEIIEGEEIEIGCANSGNVHWIPETGLFINGLTATATDSVLEDFIYTCTYGDTSQCGFVCSYEFVIKKYPVALFELSDVDICEGDCITILDESEFTQGAFTYILEGPTVETYTQSGSVEICPEVGSYSLSMVVWNDIGFDTFFIDNIEIRPYPLEDNIQDYSISVFIGDTISLINPFEGTSLWYLQDSIDVCLICDTIHFVATSSTQVTVSSYLFDNCILERDFEIYVNTEEHTIFLPTGFTPNDDGVNDTWRPYHHKSIKILKTTIFNRWGARVFASDDENPEWTGIYGDKLAHLGVYIVMVEYIDSGELKISTGDITLYR